MNACSAWFVRQQEDILFHMFPGIVSSVVKKAEK
jgi:hypothetical protein